MSGIWALISIAGSATLALAAVVVIRLEMVGTLMLALFFTFTECSAGGFGLGGPALNFGFSRGCITCTTSNMANKMTTR
jgi:hypothetical protein